MNVKEFIANGLWDSLTDVFTVTLPVARYPEETLLIGGVRTLGTLQYDDSSIVTNGVKHDRGWYVIAPQIYIHHNYIDNADYNYDVGDYLTKSVQIKQHRVSQLLYIDNAVVGSDILMATGTSVVHQAYNKLNILMNSVWKSEKLRTLCDLRDQGGIHWNVEISAPLANIVIPDELLFWHYTTQ